MAYIPAQQARKVFTTALANIYQDFIEAPSFLSSFATNKNYRTMTVQTLARRGTEKIAVDEIRGSKGNLNQMTRESLLEYLPPYYKEMINISAMNIYDISFEAGDSYNIAQIEALAQKTATGLNEVHKMVLRAVELQWSQAFETGVVVVKNGDSIDYNRDSSMIEVLTGDELWDATGVDIFKFFEDKSILLRTKGKVTGGQTVNTIMGSKAWQAFRSNKDVTNGNNLFVKNSLDFRQNPIMESQGGVYRATLRVGIYNFDIWTYDEYYDNADGESTRFWDPTMVCMIPESFRGETSWAQVPRLPDFIRQDPISNRVFTKLRGKMNGVDLYDYVNKEDEVYFAGIKAAPLAQLISVDRVYTAKVLEDGAVVG